MTYGQLANVAISFQNSFGTSNVDSQYFIPRISGGLALDIPPLISETQRGVFDEGDTFEGPRTVAGDLETEAMPIPLGVLLKAIMGDPVTVQSDGIYAHTFTPRVADWDEKAANIPVTYEQDLNTGSAQQFFDLNGNTLEIGIAAGELLKAKIGFVGGNFAQVAPAAASYPVGKRWTWDTASFSIGTSAQSVIMDMSITLDEALEAQHVLNGSKYPGRIKHTGNRTVAVGGTLKFDNQNEYQEFLSQSERELIINFIGPTEIQSGYFDTVEIKLPLMRYSELKPMAGGPGPIEVSISAMGKYSPSSATALQITLTNTQAAY